MIYSEECPMQTWEECIFCWFGMECLYISINPIWSNMSFKANILLLSFYLYDLFIDVNVLLTPPYDYYYVAVSFLFICFIYLGASMLEAYIFINAISSCWIDPFLLCNALLCISLWYVLKCFVWCNYTNLLLVSICMQYLFSIPLFSVCVWP